LPAAIEIVVGIAHHNTAGSLLKATGCSIYEELMNAQSAA
jgi:hypothetical protein